MMNQTVSHAMVMAQIRMSYSRTGCHWDHESPLVNPRGVEGFTPIRIQQATAAICSNWGEATHDSWLICQMVIGNPRPISAFPHRFLLLKIESIESSISQYDSVSPLTPTS